MLGVELQNPGPITRVAAGSSAIRPQIPASDRQESNQRRAALSSTTELSFGCAYDARPPDGDQRAERRFFARPLGLPRRAAICAAASRVGRVVTVRFAPAWRRRRVPAEPVPDLLRREHILRQAPRRAVAARLRRAGRWRSRPSPARTTRHSRVAGAYGPAASVRW